MATPIVAPYVPSYAANEPYITTGEFIAAGTGVNVATLVVGGTTEQNTDALEAKILAASGMADSFCNQVLACTTEVMVGSFRITDSALRIPVTQLPVVQVNSISIGTPQNMTELDTLAYVTFPFPNVVAVPYTGVNGNRVDVVMTYLAGFANTRLTADAAAAATVLTVGNTLGMVPGLRLTIADSGKTETVTVLTVTDTTVTLTAPTSFDHDAGTSLSALPAAIKQAVILLASVLIKTRGTQAVVLQSMSGGTQTIMGVDPSATRELGEAKQLLTQFVRVA